jgi:drug/metabolite transporter (DMT)-like permease
MNYFVMRDGQEYGPYSLADLQRYVASGQILATDLARSEGMPESLPVSQIIGTIPVPVAAPIPVAGPPMPDYPDPPNLHWGLVLLFGILSCGVFSIVWDLILASWMKRVAPQSRAVFYYIAEAALMAFVFYSSFATAFTHTPPGVYTPLLNLANFVITIVARFSMRSSMEEHYNNAEPIGLALSGAMTFFFGGIYFQYHFNEINRRKSITRAGYAIA